MPQVLVFGTGGIGSVYTYVLSRAPDTVVTTVCRSNYDAVRTSGIKIDSKIFGQVSVVPNHVVRHVSEAKGPFDFVVVTAKAMPGTAELIKAAVGPDTTIVLIQNGIAIEDEYTKLYPTSTVISGVVYLPVTQTRPGECTHGALELLELGTFPQTAHAKGKQRLEHFAGLITAGGATAKVYDDIQSKRWTKLLVNAVWNPVCALTRQSDANFLQSSEDAEPFLKASMMEVVRLAQAAGYGPDKVPKEIAVTEQVADYQLSRAVERKKGVPVEPSMLTDVRFKRTIEVEALVGNPIRIGKELKVSTPNLQLIYVLARSLNKSLEQGTT